MTQKSKQSRLKNQASSTSFGAALVVGASVAHATFGLWVRLMGDFIGTFALAVSRSVIILGILLVAALGSRQLGRIRWRRDAKGLVLLLLATAFIPAPYFYAINQIGLGLSTAILYGGLVISAFVCGRILDAERYTLTKFIATVLGAAGLALIALPTASTIGLLGFAAAVVSGVASGLAMVVTKRLPYNAVETTALRWGATLLSNLPLMVLFGQHIPDIRLDINWLYLVLSAVASCAASWMLIAGVKRIDTGIAGILSLLEIVFAALFGSLVFHEQITMIEAAGIVCIVMSASVPYARQKYFAHSLTR